MKNIKKKENNILNGVLDKVSFGCSWKSILRGGVRELGELEVKGGLIGKNKLFINTDYWIRI